jgi:mycothiol synthase
MSTCRPARREDLEAAAELLNEHSRRLHGVDDTTPAELLQYWESPDVELEQDVLVTEADDGTLAGYADIGLHGDRVWLDVRATDPAVLPALLAAIEHRAADKKPGADLIAYGSVEDEPLRQLFEASGYTLIRHSFRMRIELDKEVAEPRWPDGVAVRTMREGDERRVYDTHTASFTGTWMFEQEPYDSWTHWFVEDPAFDPSLWLLAEAGDDLVGIVIARPNESEPGVGWVRILGVVPEYRRRGLGEALLRRSFSEFKSRGFDAVGLGVDAENPTGAVRLYERAGMYVARTYLLFERSGG